MRLAEKAERQKHQQPSDRLGENKITDVAKAAESPFQEDTKAANGSSIALLMEFGAHRVLLGADAFPSVIERSVDKLLVGKSGARLDLAAFKVCHHGSKNNTSPELARKLAARSLLVSTSGTKHDHPHQESIARLLHFGSGTDVDLYFNYRTCFNGGWDDHYLRRQYKYATRYPYDQASGVVVRIED
jgi:beta-lactamase superfamily II metal-dependent hydrolase